MIIEWKNLNEFEQDALSEAYGYNAIEFHQRSDGDEMIAAIVKLGEMGLMEVYKSERNDGDYQASLTALGKQVYRGKSVEVTDTSALVQQASAQVAGAVKPTYEELERANSKLTAQIQLYKHSVERERERADLRHDNQVMLYRALRDAAPDVAKEIAPKLAGNINEWDKMMSERSRLTDEVARLRAQINNPVFGDIEEANEVINQQNDVIAKLRAALEEITATNRYTMINAELGEVVTVLQEQVQDMKAVAHEALQASE